MKWIDSKDLVKWATLSSRSCQENISYLVSKLIRATVSQIKEIKFPTCDNIAIGGYDGILDVGSGTEYVPTGLSVWEFGVTENAKNKIEKDYEKRKLNPNVANPKEYTYVAVTPREFDKAKKWAEEKSKEGFWKEVRVINAGVLDEWIEQVPYVGLWLASLHSVGKVPSEGIQATDYFWEKWATGKDNLKIIPELILGGRKKQIDDLMRQTEKPSLIFIKDISREDALAFIISAFKNSEERNEDFFSRSIIVKNSEAFNHLCLTRNPLFLIPLFEDDGSFNFAVSKGHSVIAPVGADYSDKKLVGLPEIEREPFVEALERMGIQKELAEKYSKESSRNLTILRRQLDFQKNNPEWSKPENVRDIIPALILGRWDESFEGDRKIIEELSGETYANYSKKLMRWLHTPDSPFVKIDSLWRLVSPLDAWTYVSKNILESDFKLLRDGFAKIISEKDPSLEIPEDKKDLIVLYGKSRHYSQWAREGIIQSLILVSIYGDEVKINLPQNSDLWVDSIIAELLNNKDILFWKSISDLFPLLAEASPKAFLASIEQLIDIENSPIRSLFDEEEGFLYTHAYHTGLLWALENLAWLPDYLSRASLLLAKLSDIDPGGKLANRPLNSLSEIFKPWHYQTLADFDGRVDALKLILKNYPKIGWALLIGMLPEHNDIGLFTHKMRWREFDQVSKGYYSYHELAQTYSVVIDLLIENFDNTEKKLYQLVKESVNMTPAERDKVFKFIHASLDKVEQIEYTTWHKLRELLDWHRSHPKTKWALPESSLKPYEELYHLLEPKDKIQKVIWMFNEYSARFPEGFEYPKIPHDEQVRIITERRVEVLKSIYSEFGIDKIIELAGGVKEPRVLGDILARFLEKEEEIITLCKFLDNKPENLEFIHSFILRKSLINGMDWVYGLFEKLKNLNFSDYSLAQLLLPVDQTLTLWAFIDSTNKELRAIYWNFVVPTFWDIPADHKLIGINSLLEFHRVYSAIRVSSHFLEELPTEKLVEILNSLVYEKSHESVRLVGYELNNIFEMLDKRDDMDKSVMCDLEWLYMPMLASYGSLRKPKVLHEKLSSNPKFFIEVIKKVYAPKDEELREQENKEKSEEEIQLEAQVNYELLNSWKSIPGVDEEGNINAEYLNSWIKTALEEAEKCSRLEIAEICIGKMLANYPESDKPWPPEEICSIIDTINKDKFLLEFSVATSNKRGSSVRGAFDGGDIERGHAEFFERNSDLHKAKYPVTATVLKSLSKRYYEDAKNMDNEARRKKKEY